MTTVSYAPQYVIDETGEKQAIILPIKVYEALIANQAHFAVQWKQEFEALINKIHARTHDFTDDEVALEVAAAIRSSREARRVDRRS